MKPKTLLREQLATVNVSISEAVNEDGTVRRWCQISQYDREAERWRNIYLRDIDLRLLGMLIPDFRALLEHGVPAQSTIEE